jgi:hypothetical protein
MTQVLTVLALEGLNTATDMMPTFGEWFTRLWGAACSMNARHPDLQRHKQTQLPLHMCAVLNISPRPSLIGNDLRSTAPKSSCLNVKPSGVCCPTHTQ